MKKTLLGVFFLLFLHFSFAQSIELSIDTAWVLGHPDTTDIVFHAKAKNLTNQPIQLRWVKEDLNFPAGWEAAICDNNNCYASFVTTNYNPTGNPKIPVLLNPGEESIMDPHLYPNKVSGKGAVRVCVSLVSDPLNYVDCMIVNFDVSATSSTNDLSKAEFRVYPNPTYDYFSIQNTEGIAAVNLYNMVGKKIRTFDALSGKRYYIGDLASGMYLASLVDNSGRTAKTVRIVKRTLMP